LSPSRSGISFLRRCRAIIRAEGVRLSPERGAHALAQALEAAHALSTM
jgi:hypothetical protein